MHQGGEGYCSLQAEGTGSVNTKGHGVWAWCVCACLEHRVGCGMTQQVGVTPRGAILTVLMFSCRP